jgi:CheY-like chemotaxis protein
MNDRKYHFIIIDDNKLDCFIAEKICQNSGRGESIRSFQQATEALSYIQNNASNSQAIIFLDIQMPVMNGFEFIEAFEKLPSDKKSNYIIYMISSSINENDLAKVKTYSSIKKFINKPMTSNALSLLLADS